MVAIMPEVRSGHRSMPFTVVRWSLRSRRRQIQHVSSEPVSHNARLKVSDTPVVVAPPSRQLQAGRLGVHSVHAPPPWNAHLFFAYAATITPVTGVLTVQAGHRLFATPAGLWSPEMSLITPACRGPSSPVPPATSLEAEQ